MGEKPDLGSNPLPRGGGRGRHFAKVKNRNQITKNINQTFCQGGGWVGAVAWQRITAKVRLFAHLPRPLNEVGRAARILVAVDATNLP